jgi:hypothetical protein
LAASDRLSTQPVEHAESPGKHWQVLPAQAWPVVQVMPHAPQLLVLLSVVVHTPPHSCCPVEQGSSGFPFLLASVLSAGLQPAANNNANRQSAR